jgi:hypothetical protein
MSMRGRRWLRRDPMENLASLVIGVGVFMLMQPWSIDLYGWSFPVILAGTLGFVIASHLPSGNGS